MGKSLLAPSPASFPLDDGNILFVNREFTLFEMPVTVLSLSMVYVHTCVHAYTRMCTHMHTRHALRDSVTERRRLGCWSSLLGQGQRRFCVF